MHHPITRELDRNLSLKESFSTKIEAIFGQCFDDPVKLAELLESKESTFGYCDPDLAYLLEGLDGITFETEFNLARMLAGVDAQRIRRR